MKKILLCNMPWGKADFPSIQLGILKSALAKNGMKADVLYANTIFSELLGEKEYAKFALNSRYSFLTEWFFNDYLGDQRNEDAEILSEEIHSLMSLECATPFISKDQKMMLAGRMEGKQDEAVEYCMKIKREEVPRFFREIFREVFFEHYDIVAFTCSFSQTIPAISCARLIKQRFPEKIIILGGNGMNRESGEEYLKAFSWIDYISLGEGEETIPALVNCLRSHNYKIEEEMESLKGFIYRDSIGNICVTESQPAVLTDGIPIPDYEDYFRQIWRMEKKYGKKYSQNTILFETARGCWWGEKSQCMFCGLNGENIHFRAKESNQILTEILELSSKYQVSEFVCVDNVLDYDLLEPVFDDLIRRQIKLKFFWEVKPFLNKKQLKKLADAGVTTVQAGIENFSTDILRMINKGSNMLRSILFLRDSKDAGVQVMYNYLYGFPGEKPEYYTEIVKIMPLLHHLEPPLYPPKPMILQKYSGYYKKADTDSVMDMQPMPQYSILYSDCTINIGKIAFNYFFTTNDMPDDLSYLDNIISAVKEWNERYYSSSGPVFLYERGMGFINLYDTRFGDLRAVRLTGLAAFVFLCCSSVTNSEKIWKEIEKNDWTEPVNRKDLEMILHILTEGGYLLSEGERYVMLANDMNEIYLRIPSQIRSQIEKIKMYHSFEELDAATKWLSIKIVRKG